MLLLLYHWLDHAIGYMTKIRPMLVRSGLVVMDRGFFDLLVDPRRYRLEVSPHIVRLLGRLLPGPDLTILLLGDPTVLRTRKPELELKEIERQQEQWQALRGEIGATVLVDGTRRREEVSASVLNAVMACRSRAIRGVPRRSQP